MFASLLLLLVHLSYGSLSQTWSATAPRLILPVAQPLVARVTCNVLQGSSRIKRYVNEYYVVDLASSLTRVVSFCRNAQYFSGTMIHFFIRTQSFWLSLNYLNVSRNWAWDFLKFFLTCTDINWRKWLTQSLLT